MGGDVKGVNVSVPNDEVLEGADEEVVGTVYGMQPQGLVCIITGVELRNEDLVSMMKLGDLRSGCQGWYCGF